MSLSNTQYDALLRKYHAQQLKNQRTYQEHIEHAYSLSPALKELDASISSISVAQARKMLEGDDNALLELRAQLNKLRSSRQKLISDIGLSEQYLSLSYNCPDCKDTGFIGNDRCHCFKQAAIDITYTQSNIKDILMKENFKNFSFDYYSSDDTDPTTGVSSRESARRAVTVAKDFINNFDNRFANLLLYGDTGVGKTFLSNCIAKELLDSGHSVIYFTAFQLFDVFSKSIFQKDSDAIRANQNIFDCDLLIIDDLGTELASSFTLSQFFLCVNERILREKSTIISTNLRPSQLSDVYSERTFSRISSKYNVLKLVGDDIRIKKKLKRL